MSRFLIGQVCSALGVRAHVLRYWERHVELLSPAKDLSGRRMYTLRDVQLLFRLKYLVYTRGMSVEGASRKLVEEVQGGAQNRKAALDSLRGDLFRVSLGAQRLGERLEAQRGKRPGKAAGAGAGAGPGERRGTTHVEAAHVEAVAAELRQMVLDAWRRSGAAPGEAAPVAAPGGARTDGGIRRSGRQPAAATDDDFAAARSLLQRAPLLVVSPTPAFGDTVERYPGLLPLLGRGGETVLDRIGRRLSGLAREFGHEPRWLIGASEPVVAAVRGHVARRGSYGLSAERVKVYAEPELPFISAEGHFLTAAKGSQPAPAYELPLLSAVSAAPAGRFSLTLILPVTNALPRIPDLEFMTRHLDSGADVSVKAARGSGADGPPVPTGEALLSSGAGPLAPGTTSAAERLRDSIEISPAAPGEVRRFDGEDDILEGKATRGRFEMEQLLEAADTGLIFEIDAGVELAFCRSPADWDACSQQVRDRS